MKCACKWRSWIAKKVLEPNNTSFRIKCGPLIPCRCMPTPAIVCQICCILVCESLQSLLPIYLNPWILDLSLCNPKCMWDWCSCKSCRFIKCKFWVFSLLFLFGVCSMLLVFWAKCSKPTHYLGYWECAPHEGFTHPNEWGEDYHECRSWAVCGGGFLHLLLENEGSYTYL